MPGWLSEGGGSSWCVVFLQLAGFGRESGRRVRLSSPSWKSSVSFVLVGVISRRIMLAIPTWVSFGIWGQMAVPDSVVRVPISLSLVLACGQAYVSTLMFAWSEVWCMMVLEALRKFRINVEILACWSKGPSGICASFRLVGIRFNVVISNQTRSSSQVMPVQSAFVGV